MSMKKHKRKTGKHLHPKTNKTTWLSRYPKVFFSIGLLLVIAGVLLLSVGYLSNEKIGLSMLSFFFGGGLLVLSKTAMLKH